MWTLVIVNLFICSLGLGNCYSFNQSYAGTAGGEKRGWIGGEWIEASSSKTVWCGVSAVCLGWSHRLSSSHDQSQEAAGSGTVCQKTLGKHAYSADSHCDVIKDVSSLDESEGRSLPAAVTIMLINLDTVLARTVVPLSSSRWHNWLVF